PACGLACLHPGRLLRCCLAGCCLVLALLPGCRGDGGDAMRGGYGVAGDVVTSVHRADVRVGERDVVVHDLQRVPRPVLRRVRVVLPRRAAGGDAGGRGGGHVRGRVRVLRCFRRVPFGDVSAGVVLGVDTALRGYLRVVRALMVRGGGFVAGGDQRPVEAAGGQLVRGGERPGAGVGVGEHLVLLGAQVRQQIGGGGLEGRGRAPDLQRLLRLVQRRRRGLGERTGLPFGEVDPGERVPGERRGDVLRLVRGAGQGME